MNNLAVSIGDTFGSPFGVTKTVGDLISLIVTGSLAVASIIILFFLIFGGIQIIAGAGQSKPETIEKGKQAITSALIGFAITFVAYWIIRVIEIITGVPFITAPPGL